MNRFQLVQVVIIAVALCLGYNSIYYFCWFIDQAGISLFEGSSVNSHVAIIHGVNALLFAIAFFGLLNKATSMANWILTKTDLDPHVQINISVSSFLFGVIVFWGLKATFESGAEIIAYLVNNFYETARNVNKWDSFQQPSIVGSIARFIAGIILLRYAKPLSFYFEKQTDENDPHRIIGDIKIVENL